jgi:uncharacterized membrane protein
MKFFKWLFSDTQNDPSILQKNASGNKPDLTYELCLLDECKQKRDMYIENMATLEIEDLDKTIAAYEDQVNAFFSKGKIIICRIIAEKLRQLKKARKIVLKRVQTSMLPAPHHHFESPLSL